MAGAAVPACSPGQPLHRAKASRLAYSAVFVGGTLASLFSLGPLTNLLPVARTSVGCDDTFSEAVTTQTSEGGFVGPPRTATAATTQRTVAITRLDDDMTCSSLRPVFEVPCLRRGAPRHKRNGPVA